MEGFLVMFGTFILGLLVLFIGIPTFIGSVQWWVDFVRVLKERWGGK